MGRLDYENRITVRTTPDVREGVNLLLVRYQRVGLKFRGRKIGAEGLMGAILLDYLAKSAAEQDAIVNARLAEYESLVAAVPSADGPRSPGRVAMPPESPPPRKRKRG